MHVDMRYLKPVDHNTLHKVFENCNKIITVEDGTIVGGLGSEILEFAADNDYKAKVIRLGVPDKFVEQGTPDQLISECGFDKESIIEAVNKLM